MAKNIANLSHAHPNPKGCPPAIKCGLYPLGLECGEEGGVYPDRHFYIYLCMTKSLEKAFEVLNELSTDEQNEIARLIIDGIEWDQKLSASKDSLQMLAEEALMDYKTK